MANTAGAIAIDRGVSAELTGPFLCGNLCLFFHFQLSIYLYMYIHIDVFLKDTLPKLFKELAGSNY